jgi:hypothetical protein
VTRPSALSPKQKKTPDRQAAAWSGFISAGVGYTTFMTVPIDDETHPDEHERTPDEVKQGNPGRPQSDFESPPADPSDQLTQKDKGEPLLTTDPEAQQDDSVVNPETT